jgi:hypothetical protein
MRSVQSTPRDSGNKHADFQHFAQKITIDDVISINFSDTEAWRERPARQPGEAQKKSTPGQ